jgi:hypothetical protein
MERKRCRRKLFWGDDAKLVGDAAAHLDREVETEAKFLWFDVLWSPMWVYQLHQASGGLLDSILIAASHSLKDDLRCQVCLEVSVAEPAKDFGDVV